MTRVALVALLATNAAAFVSNPGQPIFAYLQARPRPVLTMMDGKGMNRVCLVELGSGCCHGNDSTKATIRACNNAIEWNSVKVRTIIPGSYDAMVLHVHVAVPAPETVDLAAVAACFPYGNLQPIVVEDGGLLGSVRRSRRMPCLINRAPLIFAPCPVDIFTFPDEVLLDNPVPISNGPLIAFAFPVNTDTSPEDSELAELPP